MRRFGYETPERLGTVRHPDAAACAEHFRALRMNELALRTVVVAECDRSCDILRRHDVVEGRLESNVAGTVRGRITQGCQLADRTFDVRRKVALLERRYLAIRAKELERVRDTCRPRVQRRGTH